MQLDMSENVEVNFPHPTKQLAKGFSFTVPEWLKPSFRKYMDQIPEGCKGTERFMRNWRKHKDVKGRRQNMGYNMIRPMAKDMTTFLYDVSNKSYTTHSFRRSAATALAEAGISIVVEGGEVS